MAARKHTHLGCLFWLLFIFLVILLFGVNYKTIVQVFEATQAGTMLFGAKSAEPVPIVDDSADLPSVNIKSNTEATFDLESIKADDETVEAEAEHEETAETPAVTEEPQEAGQWEASLYFLKIEADGKISRFKTTRALPATNSPLTVALRSLFEGPTSAETEQKVRSLIPFGTKLLSASVKSGIATINVSEDFQFNQYGIEGYISQLEQIVFTATHFPTVNAVQFLIEGQKKPFLGGEGISIAQPLSRENFN